MKVYIAAPWVDRHLVPAIADQFEAAGHEVTERWWLHPDVNGYLGAEDNPELEDQAMKDFMGVVEADAFVVLNTGKSEGKAVETGIALTMCIPVVVIGGKSHIFHYLPDVQFVETAAEAIEAINS